MNRKMWRIAAAFVFVATVISVVGILQNGDQAAYAFEQTLAAMQGKRYFHIQTYYGSPTQRHDEFWAEFNEHGQVIRVRQTDQWKREDWPVEVLEYNQPIDPAFFDPSAFQSSLPADTTIIDQVSAPVGLAQDDLSDEEAAVEVARQALEALAVGDYETAGLLFGGAPKAYFDRRPFLKPLANIMVGEARPREWYGPTFNVDCSYQAEQEGELKTIDLSLWVWAITEDGQPARWFINPAFNLLK